MIFIAVIELFFWAMAMNIGVYKLGAVDMGGSVYIHTFGAYFGVACSYTLTCKAKAERHSMHEEGNYES